VRSGGRIGQGGFRWWKIQKLAGQTQLLRANAGIRISLGDECIGEAGLYVTAGIKVKLATWNRSSGATVAREIAE